MKIFRCDQIKEIDKYTIEHEPVVASDLMERAAGQLYDWITERYDRSFPIVVFAGPGNNGGDGLALSRMLTTNRYDVKVFYIEFTEKRSEEWEINRQRLEESTSLHLGIIKSTDDFPVIAEGTVIIDAILGSGLTRPVEDLPGEIIKKINDLDFITVISVDIPSGLFGEDNSQNIAENIINADYTLSFQFPKLSFMFPDNEMYTGEWLVLPIGLHRHKIESTDTEYYFTEGKELSRIIKTRKKFDHKGIFGHGLLIAGSAGKMGAAVLGAKAALRTGIGLLTCHVPSLGGPVLQIALPEAMVKMDDNDKYITDVGDIFGYDAIGAGPGLGTLKESHDVIHYLLSEYKKPVVLDADAINILAKNKKWFSLLGESTILTPHIKEFERISGKVGNGFERLMRQIEFSVKYKCVVVLKGANTSVTLPSGKVYFNSTGNPGMATPGSGDVLTGIILSLLAQGYDTENASVLGVFLHGSAGDIAAEKSGYESLLASDITGFIGEAYGKLKNSNIH